MNAPCLHRTPDHQMAQPRRFTPAPGHFLTVDNIRGPWRPSGAVGGAGVFGVVWTTRKGSFWAALHDFAPADQLRLVDACRLLERETGASQEWSR